AFDCMEISPVYAFTAVGVKVIGMTIVPGGSEGEVVPATVPVVKSVLNPSGSVTPVMFSVVFPGLVTNMYPSRNPGCGCPAFATTTFPKAYTPDKFITIVVPIPFPEIG